MAISQQSPATKGDHGLLRQKIVEQLLTEVFRGRLSAGRHLVTQELADRFDVSHTPIREALIALAGIGIIDLVPNRGAIVRREPAPAVDAGRFRARILGAFPDRAGALQGQRLLRAPT